MPINKKINILEINIDRITFKDALLKTDDFLISRKTNYIITLNAEMILAAQNDKDFKQTINSADLVVADGIGSIFAATFLKYKKNAGFLKYPYNFFLLIFTGLSLIFYPKFCRQPLPEKISGADLMPRICHKYQDGAIKIFLLGAKNGVAKLTALKLKKIFPKINIAGAFGGEAEEKGDRAALSIINQARPDILFIAYGAPKQEKWIARNLKNMPSVKLAIGVGGAFDLISGKIKRAPVWMRNIGLEWLWRLAMEPRRITRIYNATIKFTWLILTK